MIIFSDKFKLMALHLGVWVPDIAWDIVWISSGYRLGTVYYIWRICIFDEIRKISVWKSQNLNENIPIAANNRKQTEFMPQNLFYASQIPKARLSAILTCIVIIFPLDVILFVRCLLLFFFAFLYHCTALRCHTFVGHW